MDAFSAYNEAVAKVRIRVSSPAEWVTVEILDGTPKISVRQGAIQRTTKQTLRSEIESVLNGAYHLYRNECHRLREHIFGAEFVHYSKPRSQR
jgi:hypothetical protein